MERKDKECLQVLLALVERRKYQLIGTLEECKSAREKQMPMKPYMEGDGYDDNGELIFDTWICPSCGQRYEIDYDDYEYCPNCGQHIDTSGIN